MWWYVIVLFPIALMVWLIYEWFEHSFVQYTTTDVECQNIPENAGLRICVISDLHNNRKDLVKLTERIREFAPDVLLLAGDLINKHKAENLYAEQFLAAISLLQVPVSYSAGNHELSLSEHQQSAWKEYISRLPKEIIYLDNEAVLLKENPGICISGLSLPKAFYKKGRLCEQTEKMPELTIPENEFHILLAHNPEYAKLYETYAADLIVSGHLHGGLLRLPWIGGVVSPRLRLPNCDAGLIKLSDKSWLFISRGLGSHTIPLRFFNRVEVNFLVLKGTKEQTVK